MLEKIKKLKSRRFRLYAFQILIALGIVGAFIYLQTKNIKFDYKMEVIIAYIAFLFISNIINSITTFYNYEKAARINHQNINFLLGSDISEGYNFSGLGIIYYDENGTVLWCSDIFAERNIIITGLPLAHLSKDFPSLLFSDSIDTIKFVHGQRSYTATCLKEMQVVLVKDSTEFDDIVRLRQEQAPVVATLIIDNYQELYRISNDAEIFNLETATRSTIGDWAASNNILLRRYRDDAYFAIFSEKDYQAIESKSFDIIKKVNATPSTSGFVVSLTIGIGRGSYDLTKLAELSNHASEVALSRGGNQVVVNDVNGVKFYGGNIQRKEHQNSTTLRRLSFSFFQHIDNASNILVLGHTNTDFDSLGACLAIYDIATKRNKDVRIIWDEKLAEGSTKNAFIGNYSSAEQRKMTISQDKVQGYCNENTLIVVVDCHSYDRVLYSEIVKKDYKVMIIDHHSNKGNEQVIENPVFSTHDLGASASSACEIIADLCRYSDYKVQLDQKVATFMLAGILLDTNHYHRQTGVRTFEASAYLREQKGDVQKACSFLKEPFEEYNLKIKILNGLETPIYGVSIINASEHDEIRDQTLLSKIANELMTIAESHAAFVVGLVNTTEGVKISISARSDGEILPANVITEKLGGGGTALSSGCQVTGYTINQVIKQLWTSIREYDRDFNNK